MSDRGRILAKRQELEIGRVVKTVNVPFYPDNISVRADGMFVVAGIDELEGSKACVLAKCSFCEIAFT